MTDLLYELLSDRMSILEYRLWRQENVVTTVERGGKIVAVLQQKGPEFHFFTFGGYSFTRKEIFDVMRGIIKQYGCVETTTPKTDVRQQRFNERIGFRKIGEDENALRYRLSQL